MDIDNEDLKKQYDFLNRLQDAGNWASVRSEENYTLVPVEYDFGTRNTYIPHNNQTNEYLQNSRGLPIGDSDMSAFMDRVVAKVDDIEESDLVRMKELAEILENKTTEPRTCFCEIGFRLPKLLKHYKTQGFETVVGYDISKFNVDVARKLGYNCAVLDLNSATTSLPVDTFDLIVCYHVLEHTYDPMKSLSKIAASLKTGGVLHIEIPIEPGTPRLRYGHLIALEPGDLKHMLEACGLSVLNFSDVSHTGGPKIERIAAVK